MYNRHGESCKVVTLYLKRMSAVEPGASGVDKRLTAVSRKMKININKAHELFGYSNEDCTCATAKVLRYEIVRGSMKPCESCGIAEARHKYVPQVSINVITKVPNEHVFLDITAVKKPQSIKFNVTKK